jgi:hypothetical protein
MLTNTETSLRESAKSGTMIRVKRKTSTSYRMSPEAKRLLAALAEKLGIAQSAVLEVIIREKARSEGVG